MKSTVALIGSVLALAACRPAPHSTMHDVAIRNQEPLAAAANPNGSWPLYVIMYRALNRESQLPCMGKSALSNCGERLYRGTPEEQKSQLDTGLLAAESDWDDCSDAKIDCVSNDDYALAVPRASLQEKMTYHTHGFQFVIEKCFQSLLGNAPCEVARISSRCVDKCDCFGGRDLNQGVVFYFSPKFGVTSFMRLSDLGELRSLFPAQSWTLVADEGFLKKQLDLPTANSNPCVRS